MSMAILNSKLNWSMESTLQKNVQSQLVNVQRNRHDG